MFHPPSRGALGSDPYSDITIILVLQMRKLKYKVIKQPVHITQLINGTGKI